MSKVFKVNVKKSKELDDVFKPIEKQVQDAKAQDELGSVFCQMSLRNDGDYFITGKFYSKDEAMMIQDVLLKIAKMK